MRLPILALGFWFALLPLWLACGAGNGLRRDYFNSLGFTSLVASQTNGVVDVTWGGTPPVSGGCR